MSYIHDDFLLSTDSARRLYHDYAATEPILDYHSHLPPDEIADDCRYTDLFDIWLRGDHYKWRAMRAAGIDEELCTGAASPEEKFHAWARTVPQTVRNPLFHWTHLELKRYFDIDDLLNETTAQSIWARANERLAGDELSACGILKKFNVRAVCTTDDPTANLEEHGRIADSDLATRVYPTFRPDAALLVDYPDVWNSWVDRLASIVGVEIRGLQSLLDALANRHAAFHATGCRLSDHGLPYCYADDCTETQAKAIFDEARRGQAATPEQHARFASYLMFFFGQLDAEKGWTKQLHLGPQRSNNTRLFERLGPDIGCDSIGDWPQAEPLIRYLDRLDREETLPKTIVYNINPADNYVFATVLGSFQDGRVAGKMQFGSGWWHLDQKDGIEWQLNTVSSVGLLPRFIGMLTDSRSFMSFPRHEYFRRLLCNLVGRDVETGALPRDFNLIGGMIRDICYQNAKDYLGLETGP